MEQVKVADIRPFRGVHYNQRAVSNLADVVCPPYDIISPELQHALYSKSPYNFVRLEFGQAFPNDNTANNRYTRAASTLERWVTDGVVVPDQMPALYLHQHHFTCNETGRVRKGIIARVRLEEQGDSIRPHEGTLAEPRNDRLNLIWALQANTSPILALFEDKGQAILSLLEGNKPAAPLLSTGQASGEWHEVWAITAPGIATEVSRLFSDKALYIADGHHRYESALTYRRQRLSCTPPVSPDEPLNFVMMTLVDFADPGLVILPPHRLVRGLTKSALNGLRESLSAFFDVSELRLDAPDIWKQADSIAADSGRVRTVLFGPAPDRLIVLTLRDPAAASQMMPYFHSEQYRRLEVSVVDHIILGKLLGVNNDHTEAVSYSYDWQDALERVRNGEFQLAFLLKPVTADTIRAIADAGDRMPKKSTYFYPKLPSGLIFYRFI